MMKKPTNGYVLLDSTWARCLGVRRTAGVYRITRRELAKRLKQFQARGHSHAVGFYETEAFLVDSVRDFLTPSLITGGVAILVATDAHQESFNRALIAAGIDLAEAHRGGRVIALDASQILATFMVDGMPDAARFRAVIGQLVSRVAESTHDVSIYGEMVAVLWDEGNVAAAIALEALWNDLATRYQFSLFCAYPKRAVNTDMDTQEFRTLCKQHSTVLIQPYPAS